MSIVQIECLNRSVITMHYAEIQLHVITVHYAESQSQIMGVIYSRLFLESDFVFQSCQRWKIA
jgi:hypothetical protein